MREAGHKPSRKKGTMTRQEHYAEYIRLREEARYALKCFCINTYNYEMWNKYRRLDKMANKHYGIHTRMMNAELKRSAM